MKHKPLIHRSNMLRHHSNPSVVVSVDDYISAAAETVVENDIKTITASRERIEEQLALEGVQQHYDLVEGVRALLTHLDSLPVERGSLGSETSEAAVALLYFLSEADIIPDSLPEIGFTDDARIVARVLDRNPSLRGPLASKLSAD